jgi:hypothetical protein
MKISDKIIKGVKEDWKVQTFQYDYLSHLKKKFVVGHFSFYLLTWVLMGLLQKDFFLFLQIPCMASWNYFVFSLFAGDFLPIGRGSNGHHA